MTSVGATDDDALTTPDTVGTLVIPGLPLIAGLRVRSYAGTDDYGPMAALMSEANAHDGIPWLPTEEQLRSQLHGAAGLAPAADIVIVEGPDGFVAQAIVERVVRDGIPTYDLWGCVHPGWRRRDIGGALLDFNLARAEVRARVEDPGGAILLSTHAEESEIGARSILSARGFTPVRHFFLMRRGRLDAVPDVKLPAGITVRPVDPAQHRAIWDAECEAFQDHWGAHTYTDHDFRSTFAQSELDTSLWVVAWAGDEVAAVVQTWIWPEENARLGLKRGWLERISVRRPWRRQGLGGALTALALQRLHIAGMTEAMLGVDSENPTGALGLYERLGFEVFSRSAAYQRPLLRP